MADEEKPADADSADHSKFAGLTGWPLLEQFVNELDTVMVKGHNDDINTFLTFAGLFSAVLTAFLAISFALLQPDGTDNGNQKLDSMSVTLQWISLQLFNSSTPPVTPASEDASPFKPLRSSLWTNSLWFLSLVLSLGAALLGMIAKQWLREFLSWTTMSGLSERQVLLRHIRYEAFLDWHVPAIIASIPVLLETSLIMFLIGLCILLGTLDDRVVFGLCTAAVGILVVLTISVTILPVKYPQCPYKLPAGWAILRGWQAAVSLQQRIIHTSRSLWKGVTSTDTTSTNSDTPSITSTDTTSTNSDSPAIRHKARSWKDWPPRELDDRKWVATASTGNQRLHIHDIREGAVLDEHTIRNMVAHVKDLFCALEWITDTSQNIRILQAVWECSAYPKGWTTFSCLSVELHVACGLFNIDLCRLVPPPELCLSGRWAHLFVERFRESGALSIPLSSMEPGPRDYSNFQTVVKLVMKRPSSKFQLQVLHAQDRSDVWEENEWKIDAHPDVSPSMAILIAHSIARHLSNIVAQSTIKSRDSMWGMYGTQADYYLQAATVFGCFLIWSLARRRTSPQLISIVQRFAAIFNELTGIESTSPFYPLCLPLYQTIQDCESHLNRNFLLLSESEDAPRFTRFVLRFPLGDPTKWCKDECELFVRISVDAISEWQMMSRTISHLQGELLPPLFIRMQSCADRCRQTERWSCIESWLPAFWSNYTCGYFSSWKLSNLFPHGLIHALVQCRDAAQAASVSIDSYRYLDMAVEDSQKLLNRISQDADDQASVPESRDPPPTPLSPSYDTSRLPSTPRSQLVDHAEPTLIHSSSLLSSHPTDEQRSHLPENASSSPPNKAELVSAAIDSLDTTSSGPSSLNVAKNSSSSALVLAPDHRSSTIITSRFDSESCRPSGSTPNPLDSQALVQSLQVYTPLASSDHPNTGSTVVETFDAGHAIMSSSASDSITSTPISTSFALDAPEPSSENSATFVNTSRISLAPVTHSIPDVVTFDSDRPVHGISSTIADRDQPLTSQTGMNLGHNDWAARGLP